VEGKMKYPLKGVRKKISQVKRQIERSSRILKSNASEGVQRILKRAPIDGCLLLSNGPDSFHNNRIMGKLSERFIILIRLLPEQ
jgi:hypothetical protein